MIFIVVWGKGVKKIGWRGDAEKNCDHFLLFNSACGTAKLSHPLFVLFSCCTRYVAFFELIHLNDLIDNFLKAKFLSGKNFWKPNLCMVEKVNIGG